MRMTNSLIHSGRWLRNSLIHSSQKTLIHSSHACGVAFSIESETVRAPVIEAATAAVGLVAIEAATAAVVMAATAPVVVAAVAPVVSATAVVVAPVVAPSSPSCLGRMPLHDHASLVVVVSAGSFFWQRPPGD